MKRATARKKSRAETAKDLQGLEEIKKAIAMAEDFLKRGDIQETIDELLTEKHAA